MKQQKAEIILRDPGRYAHHDRIFLNNPVIMQGMGLAPLVVLATSGRNALMLAAAVALLLTPSRVVSYFLSKLVPLQEHASEEELRAKLLPRGLIYSGTAAVVYMAVYPLLDRLFGVELLTLGIYLPLITTNCCVLGVAILVVDDYGADVATLGFAMAYIEALVCAVGSGVGFMLAMCLFSGVRKRVEICDAPGPMKGLPITLVAAAITSMSFMGFGGIVENLFNVTL